MGCIAGKKYDFLPIEIHRQKSKHERLAHDFLIHQGNGDCHYLVRHNVLQRSDDIQKKKWIKTIFKNDACKEGPSACKK